LLFSNKNNDKSLLETMNEKFHIVRGVCYLDVPSICDPMVRFATQALADKLLRKCRKDQVLAGVIAATEKCVEEITMIWKPFLLNQFLIDYTEAHDKGMKFHYSWLLLLFALATWKEIEDAHFLGMRGKLWLAAKYRNLWYTMHKG
jgi:hypothetical protein